MRNSFLLAHSPCCLPTHLHSFQLALPRTYRSLNMADDPVIDIPAEEVSGVADTDAGKDHSSSEGSDDEDVETVPEQQTTTQRRRVLNARFEALSVFIHFNCSRLTCTRLSKHVEDGPADKHKAAVPNKPEAELSTALLIAKQDLGAGQLDPREYQIELFEKAKERNTIAVLDTGMLESTSLPRLNIWITWSSVAGSGKTLIAVLLLKHTIEIELNDRSKGQPPRISFFLVCLVPSLHAVVPLTGYRWTASHWYTSRQLFFATTWIRMLLSSSAPWGPTCGPNRPGMSTSRRTWL